MKSHISELMASGTFHSVAAFFLNILYAILILLIANFMARASHRQILAVSKRNPKLDDTLFRFLGNIVRYLVLAFAVIFVLNRFGIQTTSLVALIGAAGLAVGLALQGTLSNLAAGIMLILFRPFRVGNYVEAASQAGTVEEISLFYTEMKTYDGLKLIVPNKDIWASSIKNYSVNTQRLIDLTIGVSYGSDLKKAAAILNDVATGDARVLSDPAPFIKVKELGDSSVNFVFRVWVASGDWWVTKCEITEKIKLALDEAGVEIPFPTRTLSFSNPLDIAGTRANG
ncbi:mechanosensitive ion channel family protein [Acidocella sp.]|uniref:mechanosensitive ion channel family protein n=1 Tax=Acidocella sp. TaxID=50710 RepID=UPI003D039949